MRADTLQIALAGQPARADSQNGLGLLPAHPLGLTVQSGGVACDMVDNNGNAPCKVHVADVRPYHDDPNDTERSRQYEPPQPDPARPGKDHKEEKIDQGHTKVMGDYGDQSRHHQGVPYHGEHGEGAADTFGLELGALPGQQKDEGELRYLGGLDVKGQAGERDPAFVAGGVFSHAKGDKGKDKGHIEYQQQFPALLHKKFNIHRG